MRRGRLLPSCPMLRIAEHPQVLALPVEKLQIENDMPIRIADFATMTLPSSAHMRLYRLMRAAVLAIPVTIALVLLIETCGSIEGSPKCGPFSYLAVPFVVLSLVLESLLFPSPQPEQFDRLLTWGIAYAVAIALVLVVQWALAARRRKRQTNNA